MASLNHISLGFILLIVLCFHYTCARTVPLDNQASKVKPASSESNPVEQNDASIQGVIPYHPPPTPIPAGPSGLPPPECQTPSCQVPIPEPVYPPECQTHNCRAPIPEPVYPPGCQSHNCRGGITPVLPPVPFIPVQPLPPYVIPPVPVIPPQHGCPSCNQIPPTCDTCPPQHGCPSCNQIPPTCDTCPPWEVIPIPPCSIPCPPIIVGNSAPGAAVKEDVNSEMLSSNNKEQEEGEQAQKLYSHELVHETQDGVLTMLSSVPPGRRDGAPMSASPLSVSPGKENPDGAPMSASPLSVALGKEKPDSSPMSASPLSVSPGKENPKGEPMSASPLSVALGKEKPDSSPMSASPLSVSPGKEKLDGAPMSPSPLSMSPGKEIPEGAPMSASPLSPNHEMSYSSMPLGKEKQDGAPMATTPYVQKSVGSEAPEDEEAHRVVSPYSSTKATEKMVDGSSPASYSKDDSTQLHA